jgi:hypothetical protein
MKTYYAPNQMRLAGKGWEIRNYLKMAMRLSPSNISLSEFVQGKCVNVLTDASCLRRGLTDRDSGGAGALRQPLYIPQRKTPDRRVIPFPSK